MCGVIVLILNITRKEVDLVVQKGGHQLVITFTNLHTERQLI